MKSREIYGCLNARGRGIAEFTNLHKWDGLGFPGRQSEAMIGINGIITSMNIHDGKSL